MTDHANDPFWVIAVDGGAAVGKSSTSRTLSARRSFLHVDTGSHYRAITLACLEAGAQQDSSGELSDTLAAIQLDCHIEEGSAVVVVNGRSPEFSQLRSDTVNAAVSTFAALPVVRGKVKAFQQSLPERARKAGFRGIVMEGRDIGTVILPNAHLKVFLTADPDTRRQRRAAEGQVDPIEQRDQQDSQRATAPLKPAPDALIIDNSRRSLEQVIAIIDEALSDLSSCPNG